MLRKLLILCALLFVLHMYIAPVEAVGVGIDISRSVPGINCGIPGLTKNPEAAKCCYYAPITIDEFPWYVEKVVGIGIPFIPNPIKMWNGARKSFLEMQEENAGKKPCFEGVPQPNGVALSDPSCRCEVPNDGIREDLVVMCQERFDPVNRENGTTLSTQEISRLNNERDQCVRCTSDNGYYSAIGCVRFSVTDFITRWVFGFGIGIAGLFALGCIIWSALKLQLSQGNPETVQQSREMITSCILGLLLIIFSVFLLNFVGVTILPGLFL